MGDCVVLMNQGKIEQAASPREIYARPATTFAAKFIGTPPMNLIECTDGVIAGSTERVGTFSGARIVGIRPEHISISERGFPARVASVEYLGADQIVRCEVGSQTISARIPTAQNVTLLEIISLKFDEQELVHYDPTTQHALPIL